MRNLILVTLLVGALLMAPNAYAATSQQVTVTVKIEHTLSIAVDPSTINLGDVAPGETKISGIPVVVTNNSPSGVTENFLVSFTGFSGWTVSPDDTPEKDQYLLMGGFAADSTSASWTKLTGAPQELAADVIKGDSEKLWFKFVAPSETAATTQKSTDVTISAELAS